MICINYTVLKMLYKLLYIRYIMRLFMKYILE